ncbi:protein dispatched homolog 1-like isoform X1 [Apostichopus japonicus]|uniref:protein dispatched homolog 1-like isoform X1 n=2 Tax=Stichopus japonicus TaxID=307972 RepID=UPI003AB2FF89
MATTDNTTPQSIVIEDELEGTKTSFLHGYVTSIERFPVVICASILIATCALGVVAVMTKGIPSFGEPRVGFEERGTFLSARELSFVKFQRADQSILSPIPRKYIESQARGGSGISETSQRKKRQVSAEDTSQRAECPGVPSIFNPKIVFQSSKPGTNLFEAEKLKSICRQEDRLVRKHDMFVTECRKTELAGTNVSSCCPSWSLGYAIALLNNKSSCEDITKDDVQNAQSILRRCSQYYISGQLTAYDETYCGDLPCECVRRRLIYIIFSFLVPDSFDQDIQNSDNELKFSLSFSPIELCSFSECVDKIFDVYEDNFKNSKSLDDGLTKIVGLDFYLKFTVFKQLLLVDFAYILAGGVAVTIIIWIYTKSFFITIGSLLNMALSTVLTFFIYQVVFEVPFFPFTNIASLILLIAIGADDTFVFVDLWKIAKAEFGEDENHRVDALEQSTRHALFTLLVTTLTSSSALYTTAATNVIALKCFGIFAGTILIANLVYTTTWLPAILIIQDKYLSTNSKSNHHNRCWRCLQGLYTSLSATVNRFFQQILPNLILKLRLLWIAIFILFGISGSIFVFVYPRLNIADGSELALFRHSHIFESYDQIYKERFDFNNANSGNVFPLSFIWGVLPTDNTSMWNPNDFGPLELDADFQLGDSETQVWLAEFCKDLKKQTFVNNETSFCFIDSFINWMSRPCFLKSETSCCRRLDFPFPMSDFQDCVKSYTIQICQNSLCVKFSPGLRFDQNDSINALYITVDTFTPYTLSYRPVDELWKSVDSWMAMQLSTAPPGLKGGWTYSQVGIQLQFYDIQDGILANAIFTISIALSTVFIMIIITTKNLLISFLATVTIMLTVITTIGYLVLFGWELNIFESLTFTLGVGLAVDFSIHLGVAYRTAPFKDRKLRTKYAMDILMPSITIAGLSTFSAGALMVPASVLIYTQLGTFLTVLISFSWLFSVFLFLPLCATVGPNDDAGQLSWTKCKKWFRRQTPSTGIPNPSFTVD